MLWLFGFILMFNKILFCCEKLETHFRVSSHQSTLPYNSYVKDSEKIKAYYKITVHNCTDDEATYLLARGITSISVISALIEECWGQYQEQDKKELVRRDGVTTLRNLDQSIIREIPFEVLYGFMSDRQARMHDENHKRKRE